MLSIRQTLLVGVLGLTTILGCSAVAGGTSSGGGHGIVCGTETRFLDTFETSARYGWEPKTIEPGRIESQVREIIYQVASQLDPVWSFHLNSTIEYVLKYHEFLKPGLIIAPGIDFGKDFGVILPEGCHLTAVGYFELDGMLKISETTYRRLSFTDKVAFWVHESLYKFAREYAGVENSHYVRKLTARLFANSGEDLKYIYRQMTWRHSWNKTVVSSKQAQEQKHFNIWVDDMAKVGVEFSVEAISNSDEVLYRWTLSTAKSSLVKIPIDQRIERLEIKRLNNRPGQEAVIGYITNTSGNFSKFTFAEKMIETFVFWE